MKAIKFRIDYKFDNLEYMVNMLLLYMYQEENGYTKKKFLEYFKDQIEKFGCNCENQFGANEWMADDEELVEATSLINKWFNK